MLLLTMAICDLRRSGKASFLTFTPPPPIDDDSLVSNYMSPHEHSYDNAARVWFVAATTTLALLVAAETAFLGSGAFLDFLPLPGCWG